MEQEKMSDANAPNTFRSELWGYFRKELCFGPIAPKRRQAPRLDGPISSMRLSSSSEWTRLMQLRTKIVSFPPPAALEKKTVNS